MNVQKPIRKKHIPSDREAEFLAKVENAKYDLFAIIHHKGR